MVSKFNVMKDREIWPNFFIVGAAKAGTTTLYAYLNMTNGVYMSPVKETGYFHSFKQDPRSRGIRITDKAKYLKLFSKVKDEKAIGEATPSYLRDPKTPELIHEKSPNAKIIIMLRDPVQRAFSHYLMRKTNGQEKRTFRQLIEDHIKDYKRDKVDFDRTIYPGLYTNQVKKYIDVFGSKNIKILIFEEFIKDTFTQVKEVLDFLGVDSEPPSNIGKVYNSYGEPNGKISEIMLSNHLVWKIGVKLVPQSMRWSIKKKLFLKDNVKPKMADEDGILLQKFYQEDVNNLEKLLGRKFPWKWFSESDMSEVKKTYQDMT